MKILFVGNTRRTSLALHYFTNLVKLGYLVLPYDPDYFYARHLFERALIKLRREPTPSKKKAVSQDLITLCRKNRFDIVMVMAENFVDADTIAEMKSVSKSAPLMIFHSHDNTFSPGILKPANFIKTLQAYDFVFTTKSYNVPRYKALGQENSFFIPSGYEPAIHHPISDQYSIFPGQWFDVTFIGTYDLSRASYLAAAGWNRLQVWGDRWKRSPEFRKHHSRIHPKAIYDFEFADVTSHTKCALGLLREEAGDLHTTRTFEIPACGAMQLAPRNEEILSFFREDEEIVCFDSPGELKEKLDYYLENEWKRAAIARRGFERCIRDKNTYLDRVSEMFGIIRKRGGTSATRVPVSYSPPTAQIEISDVF
jgi:spore maturation protein CgeB